FTPTGVQWSTGDQVALDAVIWCTGFRPDLGHLQGLNLHRNTATPATTTDPPTQSRDHTRLFFLGYGDWCGPPSATLIRVGPPAPPAPLRHPPRSFLRGSGDWCAPAPATLAGVGPPARATSTAAAQQARLYRSPQGREVRVTHTQSNAPKTRQPKLTKVATLTSG